jgi:TolB-like protein
MRNVFRAIVTSLLGLTFIQTGTTPARAQVAPASGPAEKILVLPFTGLNPSEYQSWLGRSIQQSLLADLTLAAPSRVASADVEAKDAAAAIDAGRKAGARYVVFGSFATADHDLRLTGQVLDVSSGQPVAPLKATGDVHDVFHLEDQIAAEIRQPLALGPMPAAQEPVAVANGPYPAPTTGVTVQPPPSNEYYSTYVNPPANNYYNNYYYSNPYPSYYDSGWSYPWYGLGFGFVSTPFFFGHHHFREHEGFHDRDGIRFNDFGAVGLRRTPGFGRAFGSFPTVGSGVFQPGGIQIVPGGSGLRISGFGARGGGHFSGGAHFGGGRAGGFTGGGRAGGGSAGGHR